MKKVLVLTSNSPRHIYFANTINLFFDVVGIISEPKSNYFDSQINSSEYIKEHFKKLSFYEAEYFDKFAKFPRSHLLSVGKNKINSEDTLRWVKDKKVDSILLFGTGILSDEWLNLYENKIINLHLGYSPRYRGSATLFWPFVNNDLFHLGATIHLASNKVDAGDIIKVITSDIERNDHYYDLTFKTIKKSIDMFPCIARDFLDGLISPMPQDIKDQKYYYRKNDFNEDVLKKVLLKYGP